jgi:hypothetical protein
VSEDSVTHGALVDQPVEAEGQCSNLPGMGGALPPILPSSPYPPPHANSPGLTWLAV